MNLKKVFPYKYVGGGYFRKIGVPKGKSAEILHGEKAITHLYKNTMQNGITIFQEEPGVLSKDPVWVCIHKGYLYTHTELAGLFEILHTEWEDDKYLVA